MNALIGHNLFAGMNRMVQLFITRTSKRRLSLIGVGLFIMLFMSHLAQAEVIASLGRANIVLGESVRLTLVSPSKQGNSVAQMDASGLNKDFDILSRSSSSQVSMVNGQVSTETKIMLDLRPKRAGPLVVPALTLGGQSSLPLVLTVSAQAKPNTSAQAGQTQIFIEAEWEPQAKVYVQGQLNLVVRIYHQNNLRDAGLDEPRPTDTVVVQIGENRKGERVKNGVNYQTLEVRYALFPQKSGRLTLPPIPMQLRVPETRRSNNSPFGNFFNQGRVVTLRTEALSIEVLPPDPGFSGPVWLPAENIALKRSGLPETAISVGDAINMQIDFSALGLTAEQLPEIHMADMGTDFSVYPDQATFENKTDGRILNGVRKQTFVLIAAESGDLTIPEIKVEWWDVKKQRQSSTTLPMVKVSVSATAVQVEPLNLPKDEVTPPSSLPQVGVQQSQAVEETYWKWLALVACLGWALTVLFWWRSKRVIKEPLLTSSIDLSLNIKQIQRAANSNQASETWRALQTYGQAKWPKNPPRTPQQWAQKCHSAPLEVLLSELDQNLFRDVTASGWQGKPLLVVISPLLKSSMQSRKQSKADVMLGLYPE